MEKRCLPVNFPIENPIGNQNKEETKPNFAKISTSRFSHKHVGGAIMFFTKWNLLKILVKNIKKLT